jgi:hypothetical protein
MFTIRLNYKRVNEFKDVFVFENGMYPDFFLDRLALFVRGLARQRDHFASSDAMFIDIQGFKDAMEALIIVCFRKR